MCLGTYDGVTTQGTQQEDWRGEALFEWQPCYKCFNLIALLWACSYLTARLFILLFQSLVLAFLLMGLWARATCVGCV